MLFHRKYLKCIVSGFHGLLLNVCVVVVCIVVHSMTCIRYQGLMFYSGLFVLWWQTITDGKFMYCLSAFITCTDRGTTQRYLIAVVKLVYVIDAL